MVHNLEVLVHLVKVLMVEVQALLIINKVEVAVVQVKMVKAVDNHLQDMAVEV